MKFIQFFLLLLIICTRNNSGVLIPGIMLLGKLPQLIFLLQKILSAAAE